MCVFCTDDRITGDIYSQLSTLLSLHALSRAAGSMGDALDDVKLRCVCPHAVVTQVAQRLGCELTKYVHAE